MSYKQQYDTLFESVIIQIAECCNSNGNALWLVPEEVYDVYGADGIDLPMGTLERSHYGWKDLNAPLLKIYFYENEVWGDFIYTTETGAHDLIDVPITNVMNLNQLCQLLDYLLKLQS